MEQTQAGRISDVGAAIVVAELVVGSKEVAEVAAAVRELGEIGDGLARAMVDGVGSVSLGCEIYSPWTVNWRINQNIHHGIE